MQAKSVGVAPHFPFRTGSRFSAHADRGDMTRQQLPVPDRARQEAENDEFQVN